MSYVFIKKWGRGRRVYHLIGADGSTPLCRVRLSEKHWAVGHKRIGTYKCRRCKRKEKL